MTDQQNNQESKPREDEPIDEKLAADEVGTAEVAGAKDVTGDTYAERDRQEGGRA